MKLIFQETRKTIALFLTLIFGFLSVYSVMKCRVGFSEIMPVITMVMGYYFGKSTALDVPKGSGSQTDLDAERNKLK